MTIVLAKVLLRKQFFLFCLNQMNNEFEEKVLKENRIPFEVRANGVLNYDKIVI